MAYKLSVYIEPHYPLIKSLIVDTVAAVFKTANVKGKIELAVSIVGNRKMRQLNKQYRNIDAPTDVLAFSNSVQTGKTKEFPTPQSKYLNIGDVIISYPQLIERAAKENTMVDDMARQLVVHGIFHLLGYDHEKPTEAQAMEGLEDKALESIQV